MTEAETRPQMPRTSKLAIASIICPILAMHLLWAANSTKGILNAFLGRMGIVLLIATPVLGAWAYIRIRRSKGHLRGKTPAIIAVFTLAPYAVFGLLTFSLRISQALAFRSVCGSNLKTLGKALRIYANDSGIMAYPAPNKWCDLLMHYHEIDPEHAVQKGRFRCGAASEADDQTPCHYAINPNCRPNSPHDTVLLFETRGGWNQFGGPEILTTENHKGEGCNVLFNDGGVRFVKTDQLGELKWQ